MAKSKKQNELATTQQGQTLPATASDFGGGLTIEGDENSGPQLSKIVMFQGTAEEEEMYGEHKRGVFLDALESRELGTEIKVMPVYGWRSWAKFEPGSSRPVYSTKNIAEVPPEDLEWGDDNSPPEATESVNLVVCVSGEPWPYLFVFKRTGLKTYNKTVKPIEARRSTTGKTPGLYQLASVDDKSADGKPYKRLVCRALGDPDPETAHLAKQVFDSISHVKARAEELADDAAGDDADMPAF